jgi:uncharacterized protein (TIGR02246 family)
VDPVTIEDQRAIEEAVENWIVAWEHKDPHLAAQDYAEDADWTNVFGVTCTSRAELEEALTQMFSHPYVTAGRDTVVGQYIRFLGSDVALARTQVERRGQMMPSGAPMGTRHTSHLRVFARTGAGWRIVSHLISDARDRDRPEH